MKSVYIDNLITKIKSVDTCAQLESVKAEIDTALNEFQQSIQSEMTSLLPLTTTPTSIAGAISWITESVQQYIKPIAEYQLELVELAQQVSELESALGEKISTLTCAFPPQLTATANALALIIGTASSSSSELSTPVGLTVTEELYTGNVASIIKTRVTVSWTQDSNTLKAIVEKSSDGITWEVYATVLDNFTTLEDASPGVVYFRVKTVSSLDIESAYSDVIQYTVLGKTAPPANVENFEAFYNSPVFNITWDKVADLDLAYYEIRLGTLWNTAEVIKTGLTELSTTWSPTVFGIFTLLIKAIDTSGNWSETAIPFIAEMTTPASVTGLTCETTKRAITIAWDSNPDYVYEIRLGSDWSTGIVLVTDLASSSFQYVPSSSGTQIFWINAIDSFGTIGTTPVSTSLVVNAPVIPNNPGLISTIIDNNIILTWTMEAGTYAIDYAEIRKGLDYDTAVTVGRVNGTFATFFETTMGSYKYWVVIKDLLGISSTPVGIYCVISQPPDYVIYSDQNLDNSGTLTNYLVSDNISYVPVNTTETWEEHFTTKSWGSPQDQVAAGFPYFLQSGLTSGSYDQTIDYGALISNTKITIAVTKTTLVGNVTVTPTISVSADESTWVDYSGVYEVYASNFRYVKINLSFDTSDGGLLQIDNINIRLDVKQTTHVASVDVIDTTGDGTEITFASLGVIPVAIIGSPTGVAPYTCNLSNDPITVLINFVSIPNPLYFKVLAYNKSGTRVSVNGVTITFRYVA